MKTYVTKTFIENSYDLDELDIDLYEEFDHKIEENDDDFVEIDKGEYGMADATPVKIDEIIDVLIGLKNRGATHVQLEDDGDHHGYAISSYSIRLSTPEEISEYEAEAMKKSEKWKKIKELREEMRKIEESD